MDRSVRSRTNSTSSLKSPGPPATPSHTPTNPIFHRQLQHQQQHQQRFSPDQLAAGLSRIRAERGSRSSSIPATPAPTPNPLPQVTNHLFPEQLAAGISNLRGDEGYVDGSSFPVTPSPTPFSPSPAQFSAFTPDQVAEGIRRLREEFANSGSGTSTGQPPTPSTTPGPQGAAYAAAIAAAHPQQLGIIPEHLAESINSLRRDEGLESGSNPATPIPTPISPTPSSNSAHRAAQQVLPEQLAAGIHRLKVEEGMSSGGSSGFPSTPAPAPTPFVQHIAGGVRPEDLAAGISRLSVIEEVQLPSSASAAEVDIKVTMNDSDSSKKSGGEPDLSQYFGGGNTSQQPSVSPIARDGQAPDMFFDQIGGGGGPLQNLRPVGAAGDDALLHSCSGSKVDLTKLNKAPSAAADNYGEAELDIVEQSHDDVQSLRRRQSSDNSAERTVSSEEPSVCTIFSETKQGGGGEKAGNADSTTAAREAGGSDPFDNISIQQQQQGEKEKKKKPLLDIKIEQPSSEDVGLFLTTPTNTTAASSNYGTPVAPTPVSEEMAPPPPSLGFVATSTPLPQKQQAVTPVVGQQVDLGFSLNPTVPITSPLPNSAPVAPPAPNPAFDSQLSTSSVDEGLIMPDQEMHEPENPQDVDSNRRNDAWLPKQPTAQILSSIASSAPGTFYPDRSTLTTPAATIRQELTDPVRDLVAHYHGESEASKRQVLTANTVTQDQRGLRQLIKAGCYRAAVNLTGKLLQMYNQGVGQQQQGGSLAKHTPSSLQIWFTRIALLVKLRQFSVAEVEAEAFGDLDRPDLYFQFYPDMFGGRRGTMVPFAFRMLLAELPQYLSKHYEALDRLYALLAIVRKIIGNLERGRAEDGIATSLSDKERKSSLELWKAREIKVLYSLANCAILHKDFDLAVSNLELLLERETAERKAKIYSALGRVYLQLGDIETARTSFDSANQIRISDGTEDDSVDSLVDASMITIASGDFAAALTTLQKAEAKSSSSEPNVVLINNMSVCMLYLGRLKEGLSFLESKVTEHPTLLLQETPVLNLCTLYELESSYAGQKKKAILDLISQYRGDGINASCLKLQM